MVVVVVVSVEEVMKIDGQCGCRWMECVGVYKWMKGGRVDF